MIDVAWIVVGFGIAVGGVAATAVLKKAGCPRKAEKTESDMISELVKNQYVCDSLNMDNVISWFKDNAVKAKGGAVFFLAKPTVYTSEMFAISGNIQQLDPEHNLIQAVVDCKKNLPVAIRLISYETKPELISDRMQGKDYMIITNE